MRWPSAPTKASCTCRTPGLQSLLREVGVDLPVRFYTDSSAARSVMHRLGRGRLKHVETRYFFTESLIRQ